MQTEREREILIYCLYCFKQLVTVTSLAIYHYLFIFIHIYYYDFLICKKNKVLKSVGKEKKLFIHDLRQILSKYHQILILRVNPQQTFLTCQEMKENYLFKYTKFSNRIWNRE